MNIRFLAAFAVFVSSSPVAADLLAVRDHHILPRYSAFAQKALDLQSIAETDCSIEAVLPAYHAAYDAWIGISHIQFGPIEARGTSLSLAFWPDPKNRTGKAMQRLTGAKDAAVFDPPEFAQVSVAAQGFSALERLLTEPQEDASYVCAYTRAIAVHISGEAQDLLNDWQGEYGSDFVSPTQEANTAFPSKSDADRAVYTSISTGLEFMHDQRLGRPLGSFDRPRPNRAEARRSDRSARHVLLSLQALQDLTNAFADDALPNVDAAFEAAINRVNSLHDPAFAGVMDPVSRLKVEVLQRHVYDVQVAVAEDVGAALGISAGFNALDGD